MPLSTLFFLVCAVGIAAALVGGTELRLSPRHALVTNSFLAYAAFVVLLVLPVTLYFFCFHGDWFLHYLVDARDIPSALVLLGFVALFGLFVGSFSLGAAFARRRPPAGWVAVGLCVLFSGAVFIWPDRISKVGDYPQFKGNFGLEEYGGALLRGGVAMFLYLLIGTVFLLFRIRLGARR